MADRPIRAVLFDVGGTLVRPRRPIEGVIVEAARAARVPITAGDEALIAGRLARELAERARSTEPFTYPPERSRDHWMSLYRVSLDGLCSQEVAQRIAEAAFAELSSPAGYELYPDALPAVRGLSEVGLSLGIVSNWEAWLPELLSDLGLGERFFDPVVVSGLVACEKPDPRIFELALSRSDLEADEVVHVGDNLEHDVHGAAGAGIVAVFLDRSGSDERSIPARVIGSLAELPSVVSAMSGVGQGQATPSPSASARLEGGSRSTR